DRFRPRAVGGRGTAEAPLRHHAVAADRRAARDRRRGRLSRLRRLDLHDRPDHRDRRRGHHRGGVASSTPSPRLRGEGRGEGPAGKNTADREPLTRIALVRNPTSPRKWGEVKSVARLDLASPIRLPWTNQPNFRNERGD